MAARTLLAIAALVMLVGLCGPAARGQDDWDVPKKQEDQQVRGFNQFALPDFDQWVLRGRSRDQLQRTQKSSLDLQIDNVGALANFPPPNGRSCNSPGSAT